MNSAANAFIFIMAIIAVAACCHISKCCCECLFRWLDYWLEIKAEEEMERRTTIHPMPIPLPFPKQKATKIIPADRYVVFLNPGNAPMSIGLPKEYSEV